MFSKKPGNLLIVINVNLRSVFNLLVQAFQVMGSSGFKADEVTENPRDNALPYKIIR